MFAEVPRQVQQSEEQSYQNTIVEERASVVSPDENFMVPIRDIVESSVVDAVIEQDQSAPDATFTLAENPPQMDVLQSPAYDVASIVSYEAILSPFLRHPLVHESTMHVETTRSTSNDDTNQESERSPDKSARGKKSRGKSPRKQSTRTSTRKKTKVNYVEEESSGEPESSEEVSA